MYIAVIMIYWHEYKKFKAAAEALLENGESMNVDIKIEQLKFRLGKNTKEQSIENLINILSNGEHFKK